MDIGQKFITIRYGTNIIADCIEKHQEVIEREKYCWFGKIGTPPSKKFLNAFMNENHPRIILYSKEAAYECDVLDVSYEKPSDHYPEYYDEYIFGTVLLTKIYFKLGSIRQIDKSEMTPYLVTSSRGRLLEALHRSMTSFFLSEYPDKEGKIREKMSTRKYTIKERQELGVNECVYRVKGKCACKGFVNYQYECERPSTCIKQKR